MGCAYLNREHKKTSAPQLDNSFNEVNLRGNGVYVEHGSDFSQLCSLFRSSGSTSGMRDNPQPFCPNMPQKQKQNFPVENQKETVAQHTAHLHHNVEEAQPGHL